MDWLLGRIAIDLAGWDGMLEYGKSRSTYFQLNYKDKQGWRGGGYLLHADFLV